MPHQVPKLRQEQKPISSFVQSIDDMTIRTVMKYFRIEDYDCFVSFVQKTDVRLTSDSRNQEL